MLKTATPAGTRQAGPADGGDVLVVDDSLESLQMLTSVLRTHGFAVRPVTSGEQALRAAGADPPDLVLLDLDMPLMDGYETCRLLKEDEMTQEIPVIFLTAHASPEDKVAAFRSGGVDYITKPFHVEEVVARVQVHIELRKARLALQSNYSKLRDSERLRDHLIHMVVHDIRTPLQMLLSILDIVPRRLSDAARESIEEELDAARRVTLYIDRLARNLLDTRRLTDGRMPIEKALQPIGSLVKDVAGDQRRLNVDRSLVVDADDTLVARFDEGLLRRVLENLISNAFKHTPKGTAVRVRVRTDDDEVVVEIVDEGPGVPESLMDEIFEPFTSLTAENSYYFSAGLGLAFCRLVLDAHGGSIGVRSTQGEGSVFWFRLRV